MSPENIVNRILQNIGDREDPFKKVELSTSHFILMLAILRTTTPFTMRDVTAFMGYSTAAATGTIDKLERLGYVIRVHGVEDRRRVMVNLTTKGIKIVETALTRLNGVVQTILEEEFQQTEVGLVS